MSFTGEPASLAHELFLINQDSVPPTVTKQ